MKNLCSLLVLALLSVLVPRAHAQTEVGIPGIDTRDHLDHLDQGDLFYPEDGAVISWVGGALEINWNGQKLMVSERIDRFGRLEFFASPDPDGEDGALPDNFVSMEGYISINAQGLPKLTIDAIFTDRVHAQRINTVYDPLSGKIFFARETCECRDQIDMSCKSPDCRKGTTCGGGTYKCYWKPARSDAIVPAGP